jgi:hypothetical protein
MFEGKYTLALFILIFLLFEFRAPWQHCINLGRNLTIKRDATTDGLRLCMMWVDLTRDSSLVRQEVAVDVNSIPTDGPGSREALGGAGTWQVEEREPIQADDQSSNRDKDQSKGSFRHIVGTCQMTDCHVFEDCN